MKVDDDDFYGPSLLAELLSSANQSKSTIVGASASLIVVSKGDGSAVYRRPYGPTGYDNHVAGGTIMVRTSTLLSVGGWRCLPREVDKDLFQRMLRLGFRILRVNTDSFALNRSQSDHTWMLDMSKVRKTASPVAGLELESVQSAHSENLT